ncbi:MAG: OmpA family protein [Deltaproteobacteria bacterium]|nr:OmpA family protein [Deltaproteobacteria bacterium]
MADRLGGRLTPTFTWQKGMKIMKKRPSVILCTAVISLYCGVALAGNDVQWYEKGRSYEEGKNLTAAMEAYDRAIEKGGAPADAYFRRARLTLRNDTTNSAEALSHYDRGIEIDPLNAEAYYERGLLHAYVIDNTLAVRDMKFAADLGHEKAQRWLSGRSDDGAKKSALIPLAALMAPGQKPLVFFDFDKADLKDNCRELLDSLGAVLKAKYPSATIILAGHADDIGTEQYNMNLSARRGAAVRSYLLSRSGIDPGRIVVKPYGKGRPLASNETEIGRAQNRRVEIIAVERP